MTVKSEKTNKDKIIIGTRGSPLALWQARKVQDELVKTGMRTPVEIKVIKTSGDWVPSDGEVRLKESDGGKGQFAKEIEDALLAGEVDIGVHSMKDMETVQPNGLSIPYMLPREDVRDAFLSNIAQNIDGLPIGSVVGTASVRRAAVVRSLRPDLDVVPFRGNVQTRIDKLAGGQVDATFLAMAGLNRLGLSGYVRSCMEIDQMLPAVGQGAIGIELRDDDRDKLSFIGQLSCFKTYWCVECERSVLRVLDGSCHTPIGVYAVYEAGEIFCRVQVVSPDGHFSYRDELRGDVFSVETARDLGEKLGLQVKPHIPDGIL